VSDIWLVIETADGIITVDPEDGDRFSDHHDVDNETSAEVVHQVQNVLAALESFQELENSSVGEGN